MIIDANIDKEAYPLQVNSDVYRSSSIDPPSHLSDVHLCILIYRLKQIVHLYSYCSWTQQTMLHRGYMHTHGTLWTQKTHGDTTKLKCHLRWSTRWVKQSLTRYDLTYILSIWVSSHEPNFVSNPSSTRTHFVLKPRSHSVKLDKVVPSLGSLIGTGKNIWSIRIHSM